MQKLRLITPRWALLLIVIGALSSSAGQALYRYMWTDLRVLVSIEKAAALNTPVPRGENLLVRVWRKKIRYDCPVTPTRYTTSAEGMLVDVPDLAWPEGPAEYPYVDIEYETANLFAPGLYALHFGFVHSCPHISFIVPQPSVSFRVIE